MKNFEIISTEYKELLKCNSNNVSDFDDKTLLEEYKIYVDGIPNWNIYGSVSNLGGWKTHLEFPNIHLHHQKIVDTIMELKCKDVCEIGAGSGVVSKYVFAYNNDINLTCVEGSDAHLNQMRQNFDNCDIIKPKINVKANIIKGIAQDIPFDDNLFDIVYTCTVMMHIPFLMVPQAAKEITRISKKYILHIENKNDIINTVCIG